METPLPQNIVPFEGEIYYYQEFFDLEESDHYFNYLKNNICLEAGTYQNLWKGGNAAKIDSLLGIS